ncbi:MAG: hypothetical protein JSS72_10750 [Armatimonadetes bacterium]|nr:hypothetical protein [Armatimonadota bacterium]
MKIASVIVIGALAIGLTGASHASRPPHQNRSKTSLEAKVVGLYRMVTDNPDAGDTVRLRIKADHTWVNFGYGDPNNPVTEANGNKGTWKMKGNLLIRLGGTGSGYKHNFDGKNLLRTVQDDEHLELPNWERVK